MREVIRCCGVHCHAMCACVCVCVCTHVYKTWTIGRMEGTFGTHMAKQGDYAVRVGGGANEGRELVKRKNVQWSVWGGGEVQCMRCAVECVEEERYKMCCGVWGGGEV